MHPTPYTLNPTPYTIYTGDAAAAAGESPIRSIYFRGTNYGPSSGVLLTARCTQRRRSGVRGRRRWSWAGRPSPSRPWSAPYTLLSAFNPTPSTLDPQPSTLNLQPSTLRPQPSTLNPQTKTFNPQPSTLTPQPSSKKPTPGSHQARGREGGGVCPVRPLAYWGTSLIRNTPPS